MLKIQRSANGKVIFRFSGGIEAEDVAGLQRPPANCETQGVNSSPYVEIFTRETVVWWRPLCAACVGFQRLAARVRSRRMATILHHRMAYLLGGTIVRIGFGFDQLGFGSKEHLKNRFGQQGHIAEDVSTGNPGRYDRCRKNFEPPDQPIFASEWKQEEADE
jgi:hypothetical protein